MARQTRQLPNTPEMMKTMKTGSRTRSTVLNRLWLSWEEVRFVRKFSSISFTVELLCPSASLEMSVYVITKKEDLI